jgi:glycosyltransferase involved in cell wall biosynthesis
MKLLVVHDKPRAEVGGMNTFIAAQNALLQRAGHHVSEVICTPQPQSDALHIAPSGRSLSAAPLKKWAALMDEIQPDAVLLHSPYYALSPGVLRWLQTRTACLYVLHDVTPLCPRQTRLTRDGAPCTARQGVACVRTGCYQVGETGRHLSDAHGLLIRTLQSLSARAVQQWVVPSRYLAELLEQHAVQRERIAVLPHFNARAAVLASHSAPVAGRLLFVGRLVPEKGLAVLLQALGSLAHRDWTLHIAGSGPERDALDTLAAGVGMTESGQSRIRWLGELSPEALAVEYAQSSMVVMPSLIPESFGLVGLEAMQHARPVVGFASGGMTEWLRDGVTGSLALWGQADSLCAAIDNLLMNPTHATQLGLHGRNVLRREFSTAAHLNSLEALIDNAIQAHRRESRHAPKSEGQGVLMSLLA